MLCRSHFFFVKEASDAAGMTRDFNVYLLEPIHNDFLVTMVHLYSSYQRADKYIWDQ